MITLTILFVLLLVVIAAILLLIGLFPIWLVIGGAVALIILDVMVLMNFIKKH